MKITQEKEQQILSLIKSGYKYREIIKIARVDSNAIFRVKRKHGIDTKLWSYDDTLKLIELYEKYSIDYISQLLGKSRQQIYTKASSLYLRRYRKTANLFADEIISLAKQGFSTVDIAKKIGYSRYSVKRVIVKHGLSTRHCFHTGKRKYHNDNSTLQAQPHV